MARRGWIVLGVLAMLAACGAREDREADIPSGSASVVGAALGQDFSYAAQQTISSFQDLGDGRIDLDIHLCEMACDPLGLNIQPYSRAVVMTLRIARDQLIPGARIDVGTSLNGLAAYRAPENQTVLNDPRSQTRVSPATGGQLVVETVDLRAGGRITGSFRLELQQTGTVIGQFDAPVLQSSPGT